MRNFVYAALLSCTIIFPASAQETATAMSGVETRVGWIGSVGENCQPNPAPEVGAAEVAGNGQIKLTTGEVQTNSVPACPGITIPAIVVFYTSAPGFEGEDSFVLTVDDRGTKSERSYTVKVGSNAEEPTDGGQAIPISFTLD